MSDLTSTNNIPADGSRPRGIDKLQKGRGAKANVRKGTPISYPALPDAGEHSLLDGQESGPRSPGRMPRRMRGGGT